MHGSKIRNLPCILLTIIFLLSIWGCSSPEEKAENFFEKGSQLYEANDFIRAKLELKNVLQINPEHVKARLLLARTELNSKHYQQAYGHLMKIVEIDPKTIEARLELAKLLMAGKNFDQAMEHIKQILAVEPGNVDARLIKASLLVSQNKETALIPQSNMEAMALVTTLYEDGVTSPHLFILLAAMTQQQGDIKKTEKYLLEGLKHNPDSTVLLNSVIKIAAIEKDYAKLETNLLMAYKKKPDNLGFALTLAKLYMKTDRIEEARRLIDKKLEQYPDNAELPVAVTKLWLSTNHMDEAIEQMEKQKQKSPGNYTYRLLLSDLYILQGNLNKAEELLTDTLTLSDDDKDPMRIKIKGALAKLLLSIAEIDRADKIISEILKDDPKNSEAHLIKGKIYLFKGQGENAVAEYRIAVNDTPESYKNYIALAKAHVANKEIPLAIDVLKNAISTIPGEHKLYKLLARVCLINKDFDQAEKNLKELIAMRPEDVKAHADLGDFYLGMRKYDMALAQYETIKTMSPDMALGYIKTAFLKLRQQGGDKAVDELLTGYSLCRNTRGIVTILTKLYLRENRADKALAILHERIDKNGEDAFTWNLIGEVYAFNKDYGKANEAFQTAIQKKPEWPLPLNNMTKLFIVQGKKSEAMENFKTALEQNPKNKTAWLGLGTLFELSGDYDKAMSTYKKALEQNPLLWEAANNYAFLLCEQQKGTGDLEKALLLAKKADLMKPGSAIIMDTLGWIYYHMSDLIQAEKYIRQALESMPENQAINYHMAAIYHDQNRVEEAREYMARALEGKSDFPGKDDAQKLAESIN